MRLRLSEIARITTGFPFRGRVKPEDGGDVAVVQIRDIDADTGLNTDGAVRVRGDAGKYDRYLLAVGDVLFQSRGNHHPVAVVAEPLRGIAALGLHVLRPDARRVQPAYLAWFLNHPNTQEKLQDTVRGSYIPFIAKQDLEEFSVSVPPLPLQDQIIAIDRLRRLERELSGRLNKLQQQYIDASTWQVAYVNK